MSSTLVTVFTGLQPKDVRRLTAESARLILGHRGVPWCALRAALHIAHGALLHPLWPALAQTYGVVPRRQAHRNMLEFVRLHDWVRVADLDKLHQFIVDHSVLSPQGRKRAFGLLSHALWAELMLQRMPSP